MILAINMKLLYEIEYCTCKNVLLPYPMYGKPDLVKKAIYQCIRTLIRYVDFTLFDLVSTLDYYQIQVT